MAVIFTRHFCPIKLQKSRNVSMVYERDRIGRKNAQSICRIELNGSFEEDPETFESARC